MNDFKKFQATVKSNLQKQIQADTFSAQLQGLGITKSDQHAEYLDALISIVAAGATPERIRETAKELASGKLAPTTATQLSGEHLGKVITAHHPLGTFTGELEWIEHERETETIEDPQGNTHKTTTKRRVAVTIGPAEMRLNHDTPITIQEGQ